MKKILFFVESLQVGGAQKNLCFLANELSKQRYSVTLITYHKTSDEYQLDKKVRRVKLNLSKKSSNLIQSITNNLVRILKFRYYIKIINPDVIISFIGSTNVITNFAGIFLKKKIIISERNDPQKQNSKKIWLLLKNFSYRISDTITVNSLHGYEFLKQKFKKKNIIYIPNFIYSIVNNKNKVLNENFVMAVGRLTSQKGFDLLINEFLSYKHATKNKLKLIILGEGDDLNSLKRMVPKDYDEEILFLGKTDPYPYYKKCKMLIISSRYEGIPNILLEGMILGLTMIVANSNVGIDAYLTNMKNAIILDKDNKINSISKAIKFVLKNPKISKELGFNANQQIKLHDNQKIINQWKELIDK